MAHALEVFTKYLNSKNLKVTKERKAVLEEIFQTKGHLEAEDLASNLRKKRKGASRATIYRTLDLLVESGIVRKVGLGHGHSHYELVLDHPHHEHMVCISCGRVIEFSDKAIEKALNRLCRKNKFELTAHRFEIYGYCERCKKSIGHENST